MSMTNETASSYMTEAEESGPIGEQWLRLCSADQSERISGSTLVSVAILQDQKLPTSKRECVLPVR